MDSEHIRAVLVRGSKSVECDWWFQREPKKHNLSRLYVAPRAVTDVSHGDEDVIFLTDRDGTTALSTERSQAIGALEYLWINDDVRELPTSVFLLPDTGGYVARSDFMVYRLQGCPQVASASSLASPLSKICPFSGSVNSRENIAGALEASVGVAELSPVASVEHLERELEQRLSLSWLQPSAIRQYRVCVVVGPQIALNWLSRWEAAAALGVQLVVLSSGNWWADQREMTHLREAFIPIDLTCDDNLPKRIVKAVKSYPQPIDGIFTPTDDYLVSVAHAAEALDLFTPGAKPFIISTDKFHTRMFSGRDTGNTFVAKSISELESHIGDQGETDLRFPVVCKPSQGRGSEGVFRADSPVELRDAVSRILAIRDHPNGVVVEEYVDGPELDVNLVVHNGRLLFSEVVDDFPCSADDASGGTFNETQTHTPSGLPPEEQRAATDAMMEAVCLQGFRTGVFHCEARVRHSRVKYAVDDPSMSFPVLRDAAQSENASVFLHEINARSPGMGSSTASLLSSGVDYWALQILCAVHDWDRFEAMATPFLNAPTNYVSLANIAVDVTMAEMNALGVTLMGKTRIDIDRDADPARRLREDLMQHVPYNVSVAKPSHWYGGQRGVWRWFTTGVVVSSQSRIHALSLVVEFAKAYGALLRKGGDEDRTP